MQTVVQMAIWTKPYGVFGYTNGLVHIRDISQMRKPAQQ